MVTSTAARFVRIAMFIAFVAALLLAGHQTASQSQATGDDADGDGATDFAEELVGSDPNDANSFPESTGAEYVSSLIGIPRPLCTDGVDNDLDGLTDADDPGCTDSDNDIISDDAEIDLGSDPNDSASFPEDARVDTVLEEFGIPISFCGDLIDNDGDGLTDAEDPGCDPVDSDGDGVQDATEKRFGSDPRDASSSPEHEGANPGSCADGLDNDQNSLIDASDPGCSSPQNDDRANATTIDSVPYTDGPLSFKNATIEPNEPRPNCGLGTGTVWYRYQASADSTLIATASGEDLYTVIAVYEENANGLQQVACGRDLLGFGARAVFSVAADGSYLFQVGAYSSGSGTAPALTFEIAEGTPPANDGFLDAVPIEALPFSDSVDTTAASAQFGEPTCGYTNESSVWYTFTPDSDISVVADTRGSDYQALISIWTDSKFGLVRYDCGYPGAALALNAEAGETYFIQITRAPDYLAVPVPTAGLVLPPGLELPGFNLQFNLAVAVPPANDDFANAIDVGVLPSTETGNNLTATTEAGEPAPACLEPYTLTDTIWYRYTAPTDQILVADTLGSGSYQLGLAVYAGSSLASLDEVGCSPGYYTTGLGVEASAGETYYIQIGELGYDNLYLSGDPGQEGGSSGATLAPDPHDIVLKLRSLETPACPAPQFTVGDKLDDARGFFFGPPPAELYRPDITSVSGSFTDNEFCVTIEFAEPLPEVTGLQNGPFLEIPFDADQSMTTGFRGFGSRCGDNLQLGVDAYVYVLPGNILPIIDVFDYSAIEISSPPVAGISPPEFLGLVLRDDNTVTVVVPREAIGGDESFAFKVSVGADGYEDCVPNGGYITSPIPAAMGDVDCDGAITSIDAALIQQMWADLINSLPCQHLADVNGTEVIGPIDALLILQYNAGLLNDLTPP